MMDAPWTLRRVDTVSDDEIAGLSRLLIDCVEGGSSVSFMHPLSPERAGSFWRRVAADVAVGARALLIAEDDAGICGTVRQPTARATARPPRSVRRMGDLTRVRGCDSSASPERAGAAQSEWDVRTSRTVRSDPDPRRAG